MKKPVWQSVCVVALALAACATNPRARTAPTRFAMPQISMPRLDLPRFALPRVPGLPYRNPDPQAAPAAFPNIGYADWSCPPPAPGRVGLGYSDQGCAEPEYRFYPGDKLDIAVPALAARLNRTVTVQPDGRITMPYLGPIMAADLTIRQLEDAVSREYGSQFTSPPRVQITLNEAAPLKVFVGGEVGNPGEYALSGDANALQAVIQAGSFKPSADTKQVIIIRRLPGGIAAVRSANLSPTSNRNGRADLVPLSRNDVIYVPRSGIANVGLFMQQYFRDILPDAFSYALVNQALE